MRQSSFAEGTEDEGRLGLTGIGAWIECGVGLFLCVGLFEPGRRNGVSRGGDFDFYRI